VTSALPLDLVGEALRTVHRRFAVGDSRALRYPAEVVPFATLADRSDASLSALAALLVAGEHVYVAGERPDNPRLLRTGEPVPCLVMSYARSVPQDAPSPGVTILRMSDTDAPDLVALTDLAFPGFYRPRTHEMGTYYGIRLHGQLVAMAGERLCLPGFREISAVVTHPAHAGKGYARLLMHRLLCDHAAQGAQSFLHVKENNTRAQSLYLRMGFETVRQVHLWPVSQVQAL